MKKDIEAIYPLTPMQEGMLFHCLYAADSGVYVQQLSGTLLGHFDLQAFRMAWRHVLSRHSSLRTAFVSENLQEPRQVVGKRVDMPVEYTDWSSLQPQERDSRLQEHLAADRRKGFKMSKAPLMRVAVFRTDELTHRFVWTYHHILVDGWSVALLLREIFESYEAYSRAREPDLPPCRSFGEYVAWLKRQDAAGAQSFWKESLRGFTAPTALPGIAVMTSAAAASGPQRLEIMLDEAVTAELQRLARQHRLTLNTFIQGAWALVLGRHTGNSEVLFGTVTAGRPGEIAGVEAMIGLFINTLPLRVRIEPERHLIDWLHEMQLLQSRQRQFEYVALADLQRWSELPSGVPMFETLLAFENYPDVHSSRNVGPEPALQLRDLASVEHNNYPLAVMVLGTAQLTLRFVYDSSRLERRMMQAMLEQLRCALHEMIQPLALRLSQITLLSDEDRAAAAGAQFLVLDSSHALVPVGVPGEVFASVLPAEQQDQLHSRCAAEQFIPNPFGIRGERMYRTGDIARRLPDGNLEFLGRADELADIGGAHLELRRIERLLENHPQVAQAATRPWEPAPGEKHVAAYVVPRFPSNAATAETSAWTRGIHYRIDSASSRVGINEDETAARVLALAPRRVLQIGADSGQLSRRLAASLQHYWITDDSEETLEGLRKQLAPAGTLNQRTVLLQRMPHDLGRMDAGAFDLVLIHDVAGRYSDIAYLTQLIKAATECLTSTGVLYLGNLRNLRLRRGTLICNELAAATSDTQLEAIRTQIDCKTDHDETLWVDPAMFAALDGCVRRIHRVATMLAPDASGGANQVDRYDAILHFGPAAPTSHLRVIHWQEDWRNLQPIDAMLARDRPDTLLLRAVPSSRIVRECRAASLMEREPQLRAGSLQSLLNEQCSGFGVEAAEFKHLDSAADYVVASCWNADAADHLDIWFAKSARDIGDELNTRTAPAQCDPHQYANDAVWAVRAHQLVADLRTYLQERAPQSPVPAYITALRSLPLTANGRLDRHALPKPTRDLLQADEPYLAPRTEQEAALAKIWSSVLGVNPVGVGDNFFALGGDSIRAIRVQSEARKVGLSFSLHDLFAAATIEQLGARLSGGKSPTAQREALQPFALIPAEERAQLDASIENAYPLSRLQAGMVFHSELNPQTNAYHDVFTSHIRGALALPELRAAIAELVRRHPALRTSFDLARFSKPLQLIHREVEVAVGFDDYSALDQRECQQRIDRWFEQEKKRRYQWQQAGLIWFHVHARSQDTCQFTVGFHHSILDGWSVAVMLTELFQLYRNRCQPDDPLPIAPAPSGGIADLVALEIQALQSEATRQYWLENLRDVAATRLPRNSEFPRHSGMRSHALTLSEELSTGLIELARSLDVPVKSVLLAAHVRVIAAASGESTVVTGLVGDSRPESTDSDRTLGMFLNNLPLVVDLQPGSWIELVREIHRKERAALLHRWFPMAELQRVKGGPLFEIAFNFVHFHAYEALRDIGGLEYLSGEFSQETDATLLVTFYRDISASALRLSLDYNAAHIDPAQAEQLAKRYELALRQLLAAPASPHHLQSLLTPLEQTRIADCNATVQEHASPRRVHEQFEDWARRTPDATALIAGDDTLSYSSLNLRAEHLAGLLRAHGVGRETRVAVCLDRSADLVVALLGVLKAEGAYVPLDAAHPKARLADALDDAQACVLLTHSQLLGRLPEIKATTLCMDALPAQAQAAAEAIADNRAAPLEQLAYVIYTSGSTGRPKGVMISHRALANFLDAMRLRPGLASSDVLLSVTTVAFDIAALELFLPLTSGACMVLASRQTAADPTLLAEAMSKNAATVMQATPVTWRMLIANGWSGRASLQAWCGGEAFPGELAEALLNRCAGVWNLYGPTETTIWSALHQILAPSEAVPIGTPIANTQLYVLDRWLQQLPIGAVGELYIAGTGLARGYWRRPDLTAERFVPDPFHSAPGARMYRTGDLAKRLDEGTVQVLGRTDFQVKIRGFRIELGEIESVLAQYPGVRQAVAGTHRSASGEPSLIAAIVSAADVSIEPAKLKEFLATRLPEYMVPAHFTQLNALPAQPNGKLDRRAAIALLTEDVQPMVRAAYAAPISSAQKLVAAIWAQVLETPRVGIHDNFFELGGHSLNAIQLMARLRDVFRVELPLARLFENPTVEAVVLSVIDAWESAAVVESIADAAFEVVRLSDEDVDALLEQ